MNTALLSLVIPAYNEAAFLPRLLGTVKTARERFKHGAAKIEIIVSDNGSTDETVRIAADAGCRIARAELRCIAAARNRGAVIARGDIICFVDSDAQIHPDTFNVVYDLMQSRNVVGGATGIRPERWSPGIGITFAIFTLLSVTTRLDTGLIFCRRTDFEAIGGYDEKMKFAEDVKFHVDLWRIGRKRRARLVRASKAKSIFSTR